MLIRQYICTSIIEFVVVFVRACAFKPNKTLLLVYETVLQKLINNS